MLATLLATCVLALALMLSLEVLVRSAGRDGARILRLAMAGLVPAQPTVAPRRRIRA